MIFLIPEIVPFIVSNLLIFKAELAPPANVPEKTAEPLIFRMPLLVMLAFEALFMLPVELTVKVEPVAIFKV